jgi:hypothetical protein
MPLFYQANGSLMPGVIEMSIAQMKTEFDRNAVRTRLCYGLEMAANHLRSCGCQMIYLDGSFVTTKLFPNDFDACWDESGVNLGQLIANYPVFFDFRNEREAQKLIYGGELFPRVHRQFLIRSFLIIIFFSETETIVEKELLP